MAVEKLRQIILAFFSILALAALQVHAQIQSGFISIDCGIPANSGYTDRMTGIQYTSDADFIETGVGNNISQEYNTDILEHQFLMVRSFPQGIKNCYTLKPERGNHKFLIRARFMYGNYDGQGKLPSFDLLLEADVWESVKLEDASTIVTKDIIHIPQKNHIYVCLVNTGGGTPFISALEVRPLLNSSFVTESGSLQLFWRWDVGLASNGTFRYKDDPYDRIWWPSNIYNWSSINTALSVHYSSGSNYKTPSAVMRTAVIPAKGANSLDFSWEPNDPTFQYYAYLYFAELEDNKSNNQTRELHIYVNGDSWVDPFTPEYLQLSTMYSSRPTSGGKIEFSIRKSENATLPPILNALEIYRVKEFQQLLTDQRDVDAIMNIKSKYGVKRNWQGDPCAPRTHLWQGLNCSYNEYDPPRIIFLNLSSSGIAGEISPYISGLKLIQSLDLSNNSLMGPVPDFLTQLPFLTVLNFERK